MFERKNPQHTISVITYGYQPLIHGAITRLKLRGHTTACIFSSQRDAINNQHEDTSREIESRLIYFLEIKPLQTGVFILVNP